MDVVAEVIVLAGAALVLLGAVGTLRFSDFYSRMHAAAKVPTLGFLLLATGAGILIDSWAARGALALAATLQLLTSPVAAHLVGRAAHGRSGVVVPPSMVDELGRDDAA